MDLTTLLSAFAVIGSLIAAWFFTRRYNPESVPESVFDPVPTMPSEGENLPVEASSVPEDTSTVPDTVPQDDSAAEKLYRTAFACIGKEVSPRDIAPDEIACVESLEEIYKKCFGRYISGTLKPHLHTFALLKHLEDHPDFQEVEFPEIGAIVVSATGTGNNKIRGHAGICGKTHIMSNNSFTGNWEADYDYADWKLRYQHFGGMPTVYFLPR